MKEELETILKYRLKQAEESLKDAEVLFNSGGSFRSVINRSYYAMFYSVLALFAKKGFLRSKHSGVLSVFDREYVKTKIFPKEMSQLFHEAFNLRQEGDYGEFDIITKEESLEILKRAHDFLKNINEYLKVE